MNVTNYLVFEQLPLEIKNRATYREVVAKQIIFQQGETADSIYFLIDGRVRLASFTEERIINHYFVSAGESFAETALFSDTYFCTAIADMPSRLAIVDKETFHRAIAKMPDLANVYMNQLTARFQTVKTLLELRSIRSARERILQYLIRQVEPNNRTIVLRSSLKNLAIELGLSSEALSRTLSHLQTEGVISRKQRSITLNEDWLTIDNN